MKRVHCAQNKVSGTNKDGYQPIFNQCSTSRPPENIRKFSDVFRGYKSGTLVENGLIETIKCIGQFRDVS